jgi:hypothetical protein
MKRRKKMSTTQEIAFVSPRRLDVTETAKLIRAQLKNAFPGQKFRVRSDRYAGGSSINIDWVDGPTTKQVDDVVRIFSGATFDSMIDLKTYNRHWLNPDGTVSIAHAGGGGSTLQEVFGDAPTPNSELVSIGADHILTQRSESPEWRAQVFATFGEVLGKDLGDPNVGWSVWDQLVPLAVDRTSGKLYRMVDSETERVSTVFHQFTGHRQGGDCSTDEVAS